MQKLLPLAVFLISLLMQSSAFSQSIIHIQCEGTSQTTNYTDSSQNGVEIEKFSLSINPDTGNFNFSGKIFLGPEFDKTQSGYKFVIRDSIYSYNHTYVNEGPDILKQNRITKMQLDTAIRLNRYTGQLEVYENIRYVGATNSLTIISGKYSCIKINTRKF